MVPLLPVFKSYVEGTNTICSIAVMNSSPKRTPLAVVILHPFLGRVEPTAQLLILAGFGHVWVLSGAAG